MPSVTAFLSYAYCSKLRCCYRILRWQLGATYHCLYPELSWFAVLGACFSSNVPTCVKPQPLSPLSTASEERRTAAIPGWLGGKWRSGLLSLKQKWDSTPPTSLRSPKSTTGDHAHVSCELLWPSRACAMCDLRTLVIYFLMCFLCLLSKAFHTLVVLFPEVGSQVGSMKEDHLGTSVMGAVLHFCFVTVCDNLRDSAVGPESKTWRDLSHALNGAIFITPSVHFNGPTVSRNIGQFARLRNMHKNGKHMHSWLQFFMWFCTQGEMHLRFLCQVPERRLLRRPTSWSTVGNRAAVL